MRESARQRLFAPFGCLKSRRQQINLGQSGWTQTSLPGIHARIRINTMNAADKILSPESLPRWRQQLRDSGQRLAVTNGCFDLLHAGHVTYLEAARKEADTLLV